MIPVCEPTLKGNELKYVTNAVKTGWISSSGQFIKSFEDKFSEYCNANFGVSCSSGTAAIHLAIESLGIGKSHEVIIPDFTMIAACNSVIYSGARPVLVDSERKTWNIDPGLIEDKINEKTKAIMVMHTYGHPCDMDVINKIAKEHGLYVIEDAAEAHGAEYKGKKIGSLGDVACFSFYANKIITCGEGGMVVTNNEKIAKKAANLRTHAFGKNRFMHEDFGFNYRMTNLQAAIGLAQTEKIDELVQSRINNAKAYTKLLKNIKGITTPPKASWAKNVYWMYGILVEKNFKLNSIELQEKLKENGIDTRAFFSGMHKQPVYQGKNELFPDTSGSFPISEELEEKGLYLPSSSHLTQNEIEIVVNVIRDVQ